MKRLFLTLAIAAIGFTGAYAQTATPKDKQTAAQKAEKSTAKLQKELSLSADQKQKIYAIELDKYKKAETLHQDAKVSKQAKKDQHDAIKDATDVKLNAVLTADQKKKLADVHAEKKAKKEAKKAAKAKKS